MNQLIWSIQFDGTNTALLDRDPNNYRERERERESEMVGNRKGGERARWWEIEKGETERDGEK